MILEFKLTGTADEFNNLKISKLLLALAELSEQDENDNCTTVIVEDIELK